MFEIYQSQIEDRNISIKANLHTSSALIKSQIEDRNSVRFLSRFSTFFAKGESQIEDRNVKYAGSVAFIT